MTVPDYQSLMLPVLQASAAGEVRIGDVVETVAGQLGLTAEERAELLPSGWQNLLANRVHWAKSYLAKAGLVEITGRAHFRISERGQGVLRTAPAHIDHRMLLEFPEFIEFTRRPHAVERPREAAPSIFDGLTPDERIRTAYREIEAALARELLDRILAAPPAFFERLLVDLLIAMDYGGSGIAPGRVLGGSGDGGVDAVIDQDALGLDQVYIQAKRYAIGNNVGSSEIRNFLGGLDQRRAAKGLFVTTSAFSTAAYEAAKFSTKRVVLIDGRQLTRLMIQHNVGCRTEQTLVIKRLDEEFFE